MASTQGNTTQWDDPKWIAVFALSGSAFGVIVPVLMGAGVGPALLGGVAGGVAANGLRIGIRYETEKALPSPSGETTKYAFPIAAPISMGLGGAAMVGALFWANAEAKRRRR